MTDIDHLARLNELENRIIKLEKLVSDQQKQIDKIRSTAETTHRNAGHQIIGGTRLPNGAVVRCPIKITVPKRGK